MVSGNEPATISPGWRLSPSRFHCRCSQYDEVLVARQRSAGRGDYDGARGRAAGHNGRHVGVGNYAEAGGCDTVEGDGGSAG